MKTPEGFDALREAGYSFSPFDSPRQFKMQADILDVAIKTISGLTTESGIVRDTAYLVLDGLMAAPKGFEFFPRFPKEEVAQFCRLAAENRLNQAPIPIVCPVCPDYCGHYQLLDGISNPAQSVLNKTATLKDFFGRRNFHFFIQMHMADVEAYEPLILKASGETTESFLKKTANSIIITRKKIEELGLSELIQIESMQAIFVAAGLDYFELKRTNAQKIKVSESRKVRRVMESLMTERRHLGDFNLVDPANQPAMAAEELANYSAYGDLINGQAVILSPDTLSPIPAYNFLRGEQELFNPTIYLKNVKIPYGRYD